MSSKLLRNLFLLFIFISAVSFSIFETSQAQGIAKSSVVDPTKLHTSLFLGLSSHQKRALLTLTKASNVSAEEVWQRFSISQATTFVSVTHALQSFSLGTITGLDLIESVDAVVGEVAGQKSVDQHHLTVHWINQAPEKLRTVGFSNRIGWGHSGQWGLSIGGNATGVHALFEKKNVRIGSIHVDYRDVTWKNFLKDPEGHFSVQDADIRAIGPHRDANGVVINNLERHVRWFGSISGF
jgi:hypothetical protein